LYFDFTNLHYFCTVFDTVLCNKISVMVVATTGTCKSNPVWVEHIKEAEEDIKLGNVTEIKSGDVWKRVREGTSTRANSKNFVDLHC